MAKLILDDFLETCRRLEADSYLAITGGDPFMNKDFKKILELAVSKCHWVSVLGNPESINSINLKWLKSLRIKFYQVSLDGLRETHDNNRYSGSFDRTVEAIRMLSETSIKPMVMSTVSGANYKEMVDVMNLSYSAGACRWSFARWSPPEGGDCGIPPEEYISFLRLILKEHKKYEDEGYDPIDKDPLMTIIKGENCNSDGCKIIGGCGIGSSVLTLLPDNIVMACRRHPGSVLGKWTPENNFIYHFVLNEKMKEYRQIYKIEGCKDCRFLLYCRGCRASAFLATGNHFGRDPQCPIAKK
jgi:radical SAM protein with 4Fe4S-binding SPASM domain